MKVITGEVTGGAVHVPDDLPDGTRVAILAPGNEGFRLSPEEEAELEQALQQIRSGEFVDGHALLAELRGDLKA
ncbi:MAG TPA: hypothetical protein VM557_01040 [Thermoanaerobaculia bacterium]|nr:hypothetical protein [Thermoanaerobaculia bacterium]